MLEEPVHGDRTGSTYQVLVVVGTVVVLEALFWGLASVESASLSVTVLWLFLAGLGLSAYIMLARFPWMSLGLRTRPQLGRKDPLGLLVLIAALLVIGISQIVIGSSQEALQAVRNPFSLRVVLVVRLHPD